MKPILEARCIVCHGCYDAPCQLDLSAYEGIERGANKEKVYNPGRVLAAEPTRLFVDADSPEQWRKAGFFPVLNERAQTRDANLGAGLLVKMLQLKRQHPQPKVSPLPASFDFSLDRNQSCPTVEEFDRFAEKKPLWGMPYGMPDLTDREYGTLLTWLEEGAMAEAPPPLAASAMAHVSAWETFFNGDTAKEQLMSRYLYEHLFLADLYFGDRATRLFFRLVRSKTPPGEPIQLIATRRPYDAPMVPRVYYRLQPVRTSILDKTHMPYRLDDARMARYRTLFLDPDYVVSELPSYDPETSANPFATFHAIPARSRYEFLLDEAQFTLMNFIKGPVCRGQVALNVINERFWVVFVNPKSPLLDQEDQFLAREADNLRMPTEKSSNATALQTWLKYSNLEKAYFAAKTEYLKQHLAAGEEISLDLVWDGDGRNDNAGLTVFRHFDNATVVKGFVGDEPKTLVALRYPLLERIHYLLVAGYDVYGNIGHQLNSRLYMDFMRMEGEANFLTLLPAETRVKEWKHWYRDAGREVESYGELYNQRVNREPGIRYRTENPKSELVAMLRDRLAPVLNTEYAIKPDGDPGVRQQLERLSQLRGVAVSWLPQAAFLMIEGAQDPYMTIVHNNGMSNVSHMLSEQKRRLPEEDDLTVVGGFLGAYPNAFYRVPVAALPDFVGAVEGLGSEADYRALVSRFGVTRSDPEFWEVSDAVRTAFHAAAPIEAGLFDYNRLENR
ncbi:MAG: fatty acid cis/trans isomerase [Nitrospirota bacterium]